MNGGYYVVTVRKDLISHFLALSDRIVANIPLNSVYSGLLLRSIGPLRKFFSPSIDEPLK
jgi:hypothetical protein